MYYVHQNDYVAEVMINEKRQRGFYTLPLLLCMSGALYVHRALLSVACYPKGRCKDRKKNDRVYQIEGGKFVKSC